MLKVFYDMKKKSLTGCNTLFVAEVLQSIAETAMLFLIPKIAKVATAKKGRVPGRTKFIHIIEFLPAYP